MDSEDCCSCLRFLIPAGRASHAHRRSNPPKKSSSPNRTRAFYLCASLFVLLLGVKLSAQVPDAGSRELLHGSIVTDQGGPAPEVKVEIRDLRGIKVGSSVTDSRGNFEIRGTAEPGEYVFLAVSSFHVRDQHVLLDRADLQTSLALPYGSTVATPGRYAVSVTRLGVPAKAWAHLGAADREFRKRKFDKASQEVASALRIDPTCARAFSMRAFIKLAKNDPQGALEDAQRAVLLDSDDAESFIAVAMSYNSLKEFQKGEEAAENALNLHPDSWQGRLELAKSYYGEGELIRALCELDAANIEFPDVHLVRGNVLLGLGRKREATEEFDTFLRQVPNDPRKEQIHRIEATGLAGNNNAYSSGQ